jgi:hypothetical protein
MRLFITMFACGIYLWGCGGSTESNPPPGSGGAGIAPGSGGAFGGRGGSTGYGGTNTSGGSGNAGCPAQVPRLPQYPYTPDSCSAPGTTCVYPGMNAGCTESFLCECPSCQGSGSCCYWASQGETCSTGSGGSTASGGATAFGGATGSGGVTGNGGTTPSSGGSAGTGGGPNFNEIGQPCTNGKCPSGLTPVEYCGFATCGFCSCEIPCGTGPTPCPPGTYCIDISDGPGSVCRPILGG